MPQKRPQKGHFRAIFSLGGLLGQKRRRKDHLFSPARAKPRGSGGAPPTNLILLRNQRAGAVVKRRQGTRQGRAVGGRLIGGRSVGRSAGHPAPPPPRQSRPPRHPPHPSDRASGNGGWRVALLSGEENCVQRGTGLPPSTQATTAALRFAPDTVAKESVVPANATTLLRNPLRSYRYRSSAPTSDPPVA